jgi:hypothetical protein
MYVRFVTGKLSESSRRREGVFQAMYDLIDGKELRDYELEELDQLRRWFNQHLEKPERFSRSRKSGAAGEAISWFKSCATGYVSRMHAICRILEEHGVVTEMITTVRPGYVVFEDEHQIAAVPFEETGA